MRIGIIGAGIGGLVAGLALQADGHELRIFERRPSSAAVGAGLSLFGNAFAAFEAVGIGERLGPLFSDEVSRFKAGQRNPSGAWLTVLPPKAVASLRAVHRADLHRALVAALRPGTVRCGVEATVGGEGAATVRLPEGEEPFDLVVAADGLRSPARLALGLDSGLRYAGYSAWRGVTKAPFDLRGEAGETWGRGQRFGVVPLPDGRVYWFATASLPAGTAFPDERQELRRRFAGWHAPIADLIEDTEQPIRHDVHDLAKPLASFLRGRTVLLGDAAHAMTPDLGQGAGQAIEDAATLALLLREASEAHGLERALQRYDWLRRARSQAVARRSRMVGAVAQTASPWGAALRDTAFRLMPSGLIAGSAMAYQRWAAPT